MSRSKLPTSSGPGGDSGRKLLDDSSDEHPSAASCCNANHDQLSKLIVSSQCCDQDTLTLVDGGKQCMSSRWCKAKDCAKAVRISKTKQCAAAAAATAEVVHDEPSSEEEYVEPDEPEEQDE